MEPDSHCGVAIPGGLKFSRNLPIQLKRSTLSDAIVDPRIYPGQPGLTQDFSNGEEGVDYLRRLRGAVAEGAPADADAKGGGAPAAANGSEWKERRQSPPASLFWQRGVSNQGQRRAHVGNPSRHQPARMLCGNEHNVSRRHESGSCTQIVRHPDRGSGHGSRHVPPSWVWAFASRKSNQYNSCN